MSDSTVSRCAVPYCETQWYKMGEGKLFLFHVKNPAVRSESTRKVWLCENCFESWEVTIDHEGKVVLSPLERMAS